MRWRRTGEPTGSRSTVVTGVLLAAGLAWLTWPLWDSLTSPSRADAEREAPWVLAFLVCGLFALALTLWRDAGRRPEALQGAVLLILANTLVRTVVSPGSSGVEFVHALPLLAGAALGAPTGFLVGAASALLSTVVAGLPATTLPSQALIWGLVGASGGLLRRWPVTAAWVGLLPLGVLAGVLSGVLLNLMGWGQEPGTTMTSFFPGVPAEEALRRLWEYTVETSLVYDTTRGVTTALVLLALGRPLLVALRPPDDLLPPPTASAGRLDEDALRRRRDDDARLDRMWTASATKGELTWRP
jgi:energy-coupling factor transport system substrate-specific component